MADIRGTTETDGAPATRSPILAVTQTAQIESGLPQQFSQAEGLRRRLKTFANWKSKKSSMQLAAAGFIYTGITDKVECQSCGIRLYNWQEEEEPKLAHKKYAPDCEFMITNFPDIKPPVQPKIVNVKYPHYGDYEARLKSFESWPLKKVPAQRPDLMARSGFFYIGSADRARCFHCGVTLRDWDTDDYPPCVHKQWSEKCPFVQKLNVDEMREEIEELERQESVRKIYENSSFIDCSSSKSRMESATSNIPAATNNIAMASATNNIAMASATNNIAMASATNNFAMASATNNFAMASANQIQVDGIECDHFDGQVHSQASDDSGDDFAHNPSVMAVAEMGYSHEMIRHALEKRRSEGIENPTGVQLAETIMDMEG